jgi:predicted ATP-dependent endonuclease of OLD family
MNELIGRLSMKIRKLKLSNFRCFGRKETVIDFENLTTFVGLNSSGKTTILHALLKLFPKGTSTRHFKRADFHIKKGEKPENVAKRELYIEAIIDFPEIGENNEEKSETVPPFFQGMVIDKPEGGLYVRMRVEATWRKGTTPEGITDVRYFFVTAPEDSETEDLANHRKPVTSSHFANIRTIYVPAIRDPLSQLKNASGTILWNIWRGINWPEQIDDTVRSISENIRETLNDVEGFSKLQKVMENQWRDYHTDARYNNISLEFDSVDLETTLRNLEVKFSPTVEPRSYDIDALGEGLRSLFYLSLVNSMLELEALASKEAMKSIQKNEETEDPKNTFNQMFAAPALTILAIEEPENHLAPHLLGRVMDTLHDIAKKSNAQVVVTSHTPAIVRRVEPESVRHLRICKDGLHTVVNSIQLPEVDNVAYKYVKEAVWAYPEVYFARLVVLGEGDTEEIVIPKALDLYEETTLDGSGVSVVPLGGRHVNHFWKLLRELGIPNITLLDLDLGRKSGGWARIKYVLQQLIARGVEQNELFDALNDTLNEYDITLSKESLEEMHNLPDDREAIEATLSLFEQYGVFFAAPLDIDFLMLKAFTDAYKSTVEERGGYGPRVPEEEAELQERMEESAATTLKSDKADVNLYSTEEKELMIWYNYLFLNRSKPGAHILALSKIADKEFHKAVPSPIKSLVQAIEGHLVDDPLSQLSKDKLDR